VIIPASAVFLRDRTIIERQLIEQHIPAIAAFRESAESGALLSYGIDLVNLFRDIAGFVDRVAKGAKPAELPIEPPTHFHVAVNLKTAAALGITVPQSILARADQVIE
jgi:putative ABC transport system substrate-binding protein